MVAIQYSQQLNSNDFTNWDDNLFVTNNPDIAGFSAKNIAKVYSTVYVDNIQPPIV